MFKLTRNMNVVTKHVERRELVSICIGHLYGESAKKCAHGTKCDSAAFLLRYSSGTCLDLVFVSICDFSASVELDVAAHAVFCSCPIQSSSLRGRCS